MPTFGVKSNAAGGLRWNLVLLCVLLGVLAPNPGGLFLLCLTKPRWNWVVFSVLCMLWPAIWLLVIGTGRWSQTKVCSAQGGCVSHPHIQNINCVCVCVHTHQCALDYHRACNNNMGVMLGTMPNDELSRWNTQTAYKVGVAQNGMVFGRPWKKKHN